MAQAHVYVRVQVSGSNAEVLAIEQATKALQTAVSAVGEWRGDVRICLDNDLETVRPHPPALHTKPLVPSILKRR